MDKQPPELHKGSVSNITEQGFIDPEQLSDASYALNQLDMWRHPSVKKLTPVILNELQVSDESESFRASQSNQWSSRLSLMMEQEHYLTRSLGSHNPYKRFFDEAYSLATTPEQQQALSVIERLCLVTLRPIASNNFVPEKRISELIDRILTS